MGADSVEEIRGCVRSKAENQVRSAARSVTKAYIGFS
jgi:hypothetical protein